MNSKILIVFCLYYIVQYVESDKTLPEYIKVCKRNNEVSKCFANAIEDIRPHLVEGIPELNLPSIEPFHIEEITLDQENGTSVNFNAVLTHVKFFGASNFKVSDVHVNLDKEMSVKLTMHFPTVFVNATYKAKGKVLLFQFDSDGIAHGTGHDITGKATWNLKTIMKKGKVHLAVGKEIFDLEYGKMNMYFGDLFKTNKELTENVNRAINENVDILYNDLKPLLTNTLNAIFRQFIDRIFNLFPYSVLFPTN